MNADFFRQTIPKLDLSIERSTGRVPADGKYYVVRDGKVVGAFRSFKQAQEVFRRMAKESGYEPPRKAQTDRERKSLGTVALDGYFEAKETYWAESHRHRGRGGKGGRGGI